jgi:hypothetical protein
MEEPPELQHNGHWRMAVWALRVGYLGLAVAIAGLIALAFGSTSWVQASGVIIWLATVPVTLTGFLWARHELPEPGPGSGRCGSCSSTTPSTPCKSWRQLLRERLDPASQVFPLLRSHAKDSRLGQRSGMFPEIAL